MVNYREDKQILTGVCENVIPGKTVTDGGAYGENNKKV